MRRQLSEAEAWMEIARTVDALKPEAEEYYLCQHIREFGNRDRVSIETERRMLTRLRYHMDYSIVLAWDSHFAGEPWAEQTAQDRRVLACLFLALEASDGTDAMQENAA